MARNKRIKAIIEAIKGYHTVLDIGTDHGYVLKGAYDLNHIQAGIASDLREKPLEKAKQLLKNYPVSFYQTDGFLSIDQNFDAVVIAGMGSYTIMDILNQRPKLDVDVFLMPHDHLDVLRKYLSENHFVIEYEKIIYDRHFYTLFKVKRGKMTLSEKEIYTGFHCVIDSNYQQYVVDMVHHYEYLVQVTYDEKKKHAQNVLTYFKEKLHVLNDGITIH
jgi:tRNA (adenine22-N1)-methyltransferase